jgi:hypothetical protein
MQTGILPNWPRRFLHCDAAVFFDKLTRVEHCKFGDRNDGGKDDD